MTKRQTQSIESELSNQFVFASETKTDEASKNDEIVSLKTELSLLKFQPVNSILIPVGQVVPLRLPKGMKQPRRYFDPLAMQHLKSSIAKHGVCEPILTRVAKDGLFEIVSGERRWRSATALYHSTIPSVTRNMSDDEALEIALISHLLNENISTIEETDSLIGLIGLRTDLSPSEVSSLLTKVRNAQTRKSDYSRIITEAILKEVESILGEFGISLASFVSNRLPLLGLPDFILDKVRDGKIDPSKALLISRTQPDDQHQLIEELSKRPMTKEKLRQRITAIKAQGSATNLESIQVKNKTLDQPTFENIQTLYSKVCIGMKKRESTLNRKMSIRIKRIETALRELLSELDG